MDAELKAQIVRLLEISPTDQELSQPTSAEFAALLETTRNVISALDTLDNIEGSLETSRWAQLVGSCLVIAYANMDHKVETDMARWCERQWTAVVERHPHNIPALQGLGRAWLLKAQPVLNSIYEAEGDLISPDSGASSRVQALRSLFLSVSRNRNLSSTQGSRAVRAEDTARINSANYVEARSMLRPALESFDKAVEHANLQGAMAGQLLQFAAEAYMGFGNVSHPRNNQICYQKAFRFLYQASQLPEFVMDPDLKTFFDENRGSIGGS